MTALAQQLASNDTGCITAVPAANDNIPAELRALGAAIGRVPEGGYDLPADIAADLGRFFRGHEARPANDNLPPVVAFTGLAGSGKSTATRYLVGRHGYQLVKLAGPLKDMLRAIGLDERQIEGDLKETPCEFLQGHTPRHAMQTIGTQWGRDCIGKEFWIELWRRRVNLALAAGGRVVVDDVRFPNEAKVVRELGGDIYRLVGRGGIPGQHESERGCGDEDLSIANDGKPEELFEKVDEAMRRYG